MPPPRPRQTSRSDARRDDDTPPSGTSVDDAFARANRAELPWWVPFLVEHLKAHIEKRLRDHDSRIGFLEDAEDARDNTKVRNDVSAKEKRQALERRVERVVAPVISTLVLMLLLWLFGFVHFGAATSTAQPHPIEAKP